MQVVFGQKLILHPVLIAFMEQRILGEDHRSAATVFQDVHDQDQEQVRSFPCLKGSGKVGFDPVLFYASEGRIGDHHIDPVAGSVVARGARQGVIMRYLVHSIDAV